MASRQSSKALHLRSASLRDRTVLHILTGSIAAYKAVDLIKLLRERGARVVCVMTEGAKKFITPLTVRAISGTAVYDDFFSVDTPHDVLHTSLAELGDIVLVAPASANFMARAAAGMADDLATSILLATRKPVVLAPAMNDLMYAHPMTRQNLRVLKRAGYLFVDPIEGPLVCGRDALGHIADTAAVLKVVENVLSR